MTLREPTQSETSENAGCVWVWTNISEALFNLEISKQFCEVCAKRDSTGAGCLAAKQNNYGLSSAQILRSAPTEGRSLLESRAAAVGVWTEMAVVEMICISTATVTETSVGAEGTKD